MNFEVAGLLIALTAVALLPLVWRLRRRLLSLGETGWGKLTFGFCLFVLVGLQLFALSIPQFMKLFLPSVEVWIDRLVTMCIILGLVAIFWGLSNIAAGIRRFQRQTDDDEDWQKLYLQLQELAGQPFSFVEILNASLKNITVRSGSDGAVVMLHKENSAELILAAVSDLPPETTQKLERLSIAGDVFGRAHKLGRVQVVANLLEADKATEQLLVGSGFLSAAVFPFRTRDKVSGCLALFSGRPFHFDDRRVGAVNITSNYLAMILESVRDSKEITRLKQRLAPSEEAKRITEDLFFRRGIGGNLKLREAVEFERVRRFFDADCIKFVARDNEEDFRIKASSGGAETGLLLDRRKLAGINRAVSEKKLLLLTSPKSTAAGGGYDSMPRQTLFVPVPYPDRDDLVLLLESDTAQLQFSKEKLSAVRVASVYLADLHFLFAEKREGEKYRNSVQQIRELVDQLDGCEDWDEFVAFVKRCDAALLPGLSTRLLLRTDKMGRRFFFSDWSGLDLEKKKDYLADTELATALGKLAFDLKDDDSLDSKTSIADRLPLEMKERFRELFKLLPERIHLFVAPVEVDSQTYGLVLAFFGDSSRQLPDSIGLYRRLMRLAAAKLASREKISTDAAQLEQSTITTEDFDKLNNLITGILGNSQLLLRETESSDVSGQFGENLDSISGAAVTAGEILRKIRNTIERGGASGKAVAAPEQPESDSNTTAPDLCKLVRQGVIDSNLEGLERDENSSLNALLTTIVQRMFVSGDRRLFLSSSVNERFTYYHISLDRDETEAFRAGDISIRRWRPCSGAKELPEAFQSLSAECHYRLEDDLVVSVMWRLPNEERKPSNAPVLRILAINDQEVIRELLSNMVRTMGHQITTTDSEDEGLSLFAKEDFDLVIVDAGLPGKGGWEVAGALKTRSSRTPIVVLAGWGLEEDVAEMDKKGADFVITKPFKMEQLASVLSDAGKMIFT